MTTLKWRNEILVNTTQPGNQDQSAVAALADGGFVIAWRDDGLTDSIIRWQRFDAFGAKVDPERDFAAGFLGDQSAPAIVQLSDGNLWIAQQDFDAIGDSDIEGVVYSLTTGGSLSVRRPIETANDEQQPRIASLGFQGSVAVWTDFSSTSGDIFMHGFNGAGGNSFGTSAAGIIVNTNAGSLANAQFAPDVAASKDGQRFVVVWQDDGLSFGDIRARVFDSAGNQLTAEFGINVFTTGNQQAPAVAWIAPTKFVTAWQTFDAASGDGSSTAIKYVIRNMDGTTEGGERLANSSTHDSQLNPAICALNNGGFAIAWVDGSNTGPDSDQAIRLQVFDGVGEKVGTEIVVNTTTNSSQLEPSLTTLADGRIVVSWTDFSTFAGGNGTSIRSQIIDPRGGIIDGTPFVDLLYGHDLVNDQISCADGADTAFGLGGSDQLFGAFGSDILDGGKADDFLFGGNDNDTLVGGVGDDELSGEDGNDTLRGGQGADVLDGGAGTADLADYLTVTSGGVAAALDASLAGTGEALGDTYAAIERLRGTNFNDTLRGDAQANILFGQNGANTMDGRAGADRLIGGLGIDTLTGGTQADRFEFAALTEIGDNILDFTAVDDTIVVTGTAFGGGLVAGTLGAALFQSSATNVAANATVRFIFENDVKILWFDADGNGSGAAVLVADLQASATMTNADILII
jgi:Ca2+-binding RTX toxin-like protein